MCETVHACVCCFLWSCCHCQLLRSACGQSGDVYRCSTEIGHLIWVCVCERQDRKRYADCCCCCCCCCFVENHKLAALASIWGDVNLGVWKMQMTSLTQDTRSQSSVELCLMHTSSGTDTLTTTYILGILTRANYGSPDWQLWMLGKPAESPRQWLAGFFLNYHHKNSPDPERIMQRLGFLKPCKLARRARNQMLCRTLIQKFETTPTRGRHNKSLCSHFSKQH